MTDPQYITFIPQGKSASGKTLCFMVRTKDGDNFIGSIYWYGKWRRYVFEPFLASVYEHRCLRDIADFCEEQTKLQLANAKKARS